MTVTLEYDAFISHSSADQAVSTQLEQLLEAEAQKVWLDGSEIRLGTLLSEQLQSAIFESRVTILLWSMDAAASRWVNTEWLAAYHLDRHIIPCVLDDTPLPQCFEQSVYLDLRTDLSVKFPQIVRAVRDAPIGSNKLATPLRAVSAELKRVIQALALGQKLATDALTKWDIDEATRAQDAIDDLTQLAVEKFPLDPMIVKLHGYHTKNAYMIKNWRAIQSGRAPIDASIEAAEHRFFEALWLDPNDHEGLDGLCSMFILRRDLYAAKFFVDCAITQAEQRGVDYSAAKQNRILVERYLND